MGWSKKYKKSIDCNNPKGFSQKAHCAGKKKNESMKFEEISEEILDEKLIVYNNRKRYGQVVFIAGGAGSGKGFAIDNFLDSASYKIRDVDEMKKQLQILNRLGKISIDSIIKKYSKNIKPKDLDLINKIQDDGFKLQNLNLKNANHVYALHILVKAIGIKDSSLEKMLLGKNNPNVLPNILFDITAKDITDITNVIPMLKKVGYKPNNIHLTWILTNYTVSLENNKNRSRKVPDGSMGEENIMLKTHEGASNTIWGLLTKALPKGMNGRADVILNNPELTVFMKGADGKEIEKTQKDVSVSTDVTKDGKRKSTRSEKDTKVKFPIGFDYLKIKKEGGGIIPEKEWRKKLFGWIKNNAPESITANMKESTTESVTESRFANKPEVTSKQLSQIQADIKKINRKIKVYISKHPVTKGELNIELGHGHDNDTEIDKIYSVMKKRTGDWRTGSMFNESVNESIFSFKTDNIEQLHFETNPKKAELMKIELGKSQGEINKRKQIESGEYSLRLFRKKIKYGNGKDVGVFLPGSYDAVTSKLGDGPHKKAVKKVKWTQKKYDQWLEDMASNGGARNAFDMAQNAKNEPGLIDWVKKNFRGDKPLQRIQWDIEAFNESVNEAYVVLHSPKKGVKPVATAAYADKKDAEKWAKDLGGITMIVKKKMKGIDEAKGDLQIYHKSYTLAIEEAKRYAYLKGYTIADDELFTKVGLNSKRPSVGKTTRVSLELLKKDKPQRKMLHIQVYGMKNMYELNAYIN